MTNTQSHPFTGNRKNRFLLATWYNFFPEVLRGTRHLENCTIKVESEGVYISRRKEKRLQLGTSIKQ